MLIVKGGIASAVTLHEGVGADEADVLGPVLPGVSRWEAHWPDGSPLDYLVVPANVGDDPCALAVADAARVSACVQLDHVADDALIDAA